MKTAPNFGNSYGSVLAGILRDMGFFGLVAILTPVHVIYDRLHPNRPFHIPRLFHRILLHVLGFRVRTHGIMTDATPTLFVANHTSYLDVPVLAALLPASFIAKAEVSRWPLIGGLAKLQHTVFIERRSGNLNDQREVMRSRFLRGHNLLLFPEGTSSDGHTVLPFKSSLFSIAEEKMGDYALTVQPISIVCTELDGLPLTRSLRPFYAWYGDMTLIGHLWNVFKLGHFTVDVVFHPAVSSASFEDRKKLSAWCHQQVAQGVEQCLSGRGLPEAAAPVELPPPPRVPLIGAKA